MHSDWGSDDKLLFWNPNHLDPVTTSILGGIKALIGDAKQVRECHASGEGGTADAHRQFATLVH